MRLTDCVDADPLNRFPTLLPHFAALSVLLSGLALRILAAISLAAATATAHAQSAEEWIDRAQAAMRTDPAASEAAARAALEALKRQPNPDLEIRAHLILCDYHTERDQAAALQSLEFSIALLSQARRPGIRAGVLTCQGDIAETAGDNQKAGEYFEQAVAVASDAQDDEMLAGALYARGSLVGLRGDYASGLADLQRARTLFDRLGMPHHALTAHNSIAILYSRMGDFAQALRIYEEALRQQRRAGMRRESAVMLHNIGRTNEHLGNWQAARTAFDESLQIARELNYLRGQAYALRGIAATIAALGDPTDALRVLDEAALLQKSTPDAPLGARILLERGKALHRLGRLTESANALEQARAILAPAESQIELAAAFDELATVNAKLGYWRAAYEYRRQSQQIEQVLFANRFDQRLATLKMEYDTAARERENELLLIENRANETAREQDRSVKRLQWAVIALSALVIVLLGAVAWKQRRASLSMRSLAMTDELTGVPNRRAALRRLGQLLKSTASRPCGVLIVDIDHFKIINDRHGHPQGDEALKAVVGKLRDLICEPAFVGRLGGEEFIVVLPDTDLDRARHIAEQCREHVMTVDAARWQSERPITVSIGVSLSKPGEDAISTVLQRADAALYAAKYAGRNRVLTEVEVAIGESRTATDTATTTSNNT